MNELTPFEGPFSYLDLIDGQTINFIPAQYSYGMYTFVTRDRGTKTVQGIRVWLEDKLGTPLPPPNNYLSSVLVSGVKYDVTTKYRGMHYIDLGPQKLVFQLKPLLENIVPSNMIFTLQAHGRAPMTHYSVSVVQV